MTHRFTCRMRLQVTEAQAHELDLRFDAARRIYNAVLGEMRRRLRCMRESRGWHYACKLRRDNPERAQAFARGRGQHGFTLAEAIRCARQVVRDGFAAERLKVTDADSLGKRAYAAVNRIALGQARRVRFKAPGRLRSIESDSPERGIRFRDGVVLWHDLVLPVQNHHTAGRHGARHQARLAYALEHRICFARLIRARHGTGVRYYVQLVLDGQPLPAQGGEQHLGIDLNVSQLAFAGEQTAGLLPFAPGLTDYRRHIRRVCGQPAPCGPGAERLARCRAAPARGMEQVSIREFRTWSGCPQGTERIARRGRLAWLPRSGWL